MDHSICFPISFMNSISISPLSHSIELNGPSPQTGSHAEEAVGLLQAAGRPAGDAGRVLRALQPHQV